MTSLDSSSIGIVILAAGSSQRFAGDKRQAVLANGLSLLENTLATIPASLSKRVLVLRKDDDSMAEKYSALGWTICIADKPEQGMGHSLASAMTSLEQWQGSLIGLGDMPFIKPATYTDLQDALCHHAIVTPMVAGKRGNPVGFQAKYFAELGQLTGDQGAKKILQKYPAACFQLKTEDEGILRDIDTRAAAKNY